MEMKKLARKRAMKDVKIAADEPDIQMARDPEDIASYERKKMDPGSSEANVEAAKKVSKFPEAKIPDEPDRKMMKQRKKMMMLKSLIGHMDDMDGDGVPD